MWLWMSVASAVLLGLYDVTKKQSLKRNGVLYVLLGATALSALFLLPFISAGCLEWHLRLVLKAALVTTSWVSGLVGLKYLPLTTASTIKASRPVIVVLFSIILFAERLTLWQWAGVVTVFAALWMLSRSSKREGIGIRGNRGIAAMVISVLSGAASALYDKHIMADMEPLFVQSWSNIYITLLLAVCVLVKALHDGVEREKFRFDWRIVLIAVLITVSDALYFFSLKQDGALLSVISLIRRSSVLITFVAGAIFFKEKHIRSKAVALAVLLAGITLLMFASK